MKITDEASLIGPGFKRFSDNHTRMGFWTPELGRWSDLNGFEQKTSLQTYWYISGIKYTGAKVNASPVVCIVQSQIAERDLTVQITGNVGIPSGYIISGDEVITGYSIDHQNGTDVYRREWTTGGEEFRHSFIIPAHTLPGKTYLLPNKKIYEITNIVISPQRQDQPLTHVGLFALSDNGSKLLYTYNWNKVYDNLRMMLYGTFAAPKKCPTCNGSGFVTDESDTCQQCNGYKYSGWNATGYIFDQIARSVGIVQESGESFEVYQDKVWAKRWEVIPTISSIKKHFAHFARCTTGEVGVYNNFRTTNTSGVECVVDIMLPYVLSEARFDTNDTFWNVMAESCEPAGINIRFSFLVSGNLTGQFEFEQVESAYISYFVNGEYYTGGEENANLPDPHGYGFDEAFAPIGIAKLSGWKQRWITPWFFYNLISGEHTDAVSGYKTQNWKLPVVGVTPASDIISFAGDYTSEVILSILISESTDIPNGLYTVVSSAWNSPNTDFTVNENVVGSTVDGSGLLLSWTSGLLTGTTWSKWAQPAEVLVNDTIWETGEAPFVEQAKLWSTGTYYWDNFWSSGSDGNIYY